MKGGVYRMLTNKMRNFTEKKLFLTVMSASYTLRGFAQDARGAINDVLDSFTLPVFGGFMLGGIIRLKPILRLSPSK